MKRLVSILFLMVFTVAACQRGAVTGSPVPTTITKTRVYLTPSATPAVSTDIPSPTIPATAISIPQVTDTPATSVDILRGKSYWVAPVAPEGLRGALFFPEEMNRLDDASQADLSLVIETDLQPSQECWERVTWVYALVAPFPTVDDEVSEEELRGVWQGAAGTTFRRPLMMDTETASVFGAEWGEPATTAVRVLPAEDLLNAAWAAQRAWGIVPFERLSARWKVLRVGGQTPFDKKMKITTYPLAVSFCWTGNAEIFDTWKTWREAQGHKAVLTNRDLDKMTVLNMTGVTAMVRGTAAVMEEKGVVYPAKDVGAWLRDADITHLSNEVSFSPDCPPGLPLRVGMSFCSPVAYYGLLEESGADVIELTGNHVNDWGTEAFIFTLNLYQQKGLRVFGGGVNLEEARRPLLITDHGNSLAFIGCNSAGPEGAWASAEQPGAAPCNRDWLEGEVSRLRAAGYLPVVTFQHIEVCDMPAHMTQVTDFGAAARAGAVIVSGSQAHCPQMFAFEGDALIHYGLGNLYFDQMDFATRRGFMDRHIFYDGQYLGVELATTMIEEAARPRFMELTERRQLLREIFEASGW